MNKEENIIILATNNKNKVIEISKKLNKMGIKVISQEEAGFNIEVEENGNTLNENAKLKAKAIFEVCHKPVIADDTGLEIRALNWEPGVYSSRYAGENATDKEKVDLILNKMQNKEDRYARFRTVICYIAKNGEEHYFEGICEGEIALKREGESKFTYDPIFKYNGKSFANMTLSNKNEISHRGKALAKLEEYLFFCKN